jgi:hypothetical protein
LSEHEKIVEQQQQQQPSCNLLLKIVTLATHEVARIQTQVSDSKKNFKLF